ncbi:unnamed protein product [Parascedosporium putredinis]|uniref:Uncharacterized protein n=1 Tax=Parascedosporium putredinis TaxID=1442378 RepID=A0A9P1H6P4_9PEZI|nr:unnamed protein product [Parascedosporium putredinis]CAI7997871.1 unnamed protein product [Parascedosporium putredinis]
MGTGLMFANIHHEPPPALAAVCQESRAFVLRHYKPLTLSSTTKYVDLSRDILLLEPYLLVKRLLRTLHFLSQIPLVRDNIAHLALGTSYASTQYRPQLVHQAYRFKFDIESNINYHYPRRPHHNEFLHYPLAIDEDREDYLDSLKENFEEDGIWCDPWPTNDDWRRFKRRFAKALFVTYQADKGARSWLEGKFHDIILHGMQGIDDLPFSLQHSFQVLAADRSDSVSIPNERTGDLQEVRKGGGVWLEQRLRSGDLETEEMI